MRRITYSVPFALGDPPRTRSYSVVGDVDWDGTASLTEVIDDATGASLDLGAFLADAAGELGGEPFDVQKELEDELAYLAERGRFPWRVLEALA